MTGCAKTSSMAASESPASRSMTTKNAAYCSAGSSRYLAASAHFRDDCRIVFKLRDIEKLSTQETAEALGIPIRCNCESTYHAICAKTLSFIGAHAWSFTVA